MNVYKVIKHFMDLQDNNYAYNVGDEFPHVGLDVTEDRIAELAGKENRQNQPLIEKVNEEQAAEKPKRARKTAAKK